MNEVPHQQLQATEGASFVVVPAALVRRLGNGNAAVVYARIEWRCQMPGEGRIEDDAGRWWRASVSALADETGLTVKMVRTALDGLLSKGAIEATKHRDMGVSDQTFSYRIPALPALPAICPSGQSDLPKRAHGSSAARPSGQSDLPKRANHHLPERANVPLLETEETKREAPADNSILGKDGEPLRKCPRHALDDTPPPCGQCRESRLAHDRWQTAQATAAAELRQHRRHQIDACDLCGESGIRIEPVAVCDLDLPAVTCDHTPLSLEAWRSFERRPPAPPPQTTRRHLTRIGQPA